MLSRGVLLGVYVISGRGLHHVHPNVDTRYFITTPQPRAGQIASELALVMLEVSLAFPDFPLFRNIKHAATAFVGQVSHDTRHSM
jgi:hypothetical protein